MNQHRKQPSDVEQQLQRRQKDDSAERPIEQETIQARIPSPMRAGSRDDTAKLRAGASRRGFYQERKMPRPAETGGGQDRAEYQMENRFSPERPTGKGYGSPR
jgi:hypothetical protein